MLAPDGYVALAGFYGALKPALFAAYRHYLPLFPTAIEQFSFDRFDRVLGSAEAISGAMAGGSRVARAALSAPVIKTVALGTGTSRAVRRLRRKERRSA